MSLSIRLASFASVTLIAVLSGSDLAAGRRSYERGDYAAALKELLPMADDGDGEALYLVGSMVFEGKGISPDKRLGATLFQLAADAGNNVAELALAAIYQQGDGVPKDMDRYLYWDRRAAEHGLSMAQMDMGIVSWAGEVGSKDRVQAYIWFSLCSASDDMFLGKVTIGVACAMSRNALAEEMTNGQIDEAEQRTKDWKANHNVQENDASPKRK